MGGNAHRRVLLLGPTGVDKRSAIERLAAHIKPVLGHDLRFVDFENDFLKKHIAVKTWMAFVAQDVSQQSAAWIRAWDEFQKTLTNDITILGLHATYVSGVLGLRCPINIPRICDTFKPTIIITLIDDVYNMWHRTEARAGGKDWRGRPSLEQLLVARRAEQILGDIISSHSASPMPRHILCAVGNSLDTLANLIVFDAPVTYLSFPISAPRKMAAKKDFSFIELINTAHRLAAEQMRANRNSCFVSPLAIDELPLVFKAEREDGKSLTFDSGTDRWNLEELWGDPKLPILAVNKTAMTFPVEEVRGASGPMQTDVGWRDRRLVLQSGSLAIVCPKPPEENRITRGVKQEITTAIMMGIVCNVWQKREWDQTDFVGQELFDAGSMGIGQTQETVQRFGSLEDLIKAKP